MIRREIEKYFNRLVKKFLRLSKYEKVKLDFREELSKSEFGWEENMDGVLLGNTNFHSIRYKRSFFFEWWSHLYVTYTVSFLNHYSSTDEWRRVVVHEFTHVYLFQQKFIKGKIKQEDMEHEHDDNFYSKMDYFETWIDKELNLTARKNKGSDWIQHINPSKKERWSNYDGRLEVKTEIKKFETDDFPVFGKPAIYIPEECKKEK